MYLLAFIGACVLVAMVPGVSTAIILRQTLRSGRGSGGAAMLGNETGILLWGLTAAFGLSALVLASQVAYDTMRVAGALALVYMGVQSLRHGRATPPTTRRTKRNGAERAGEPEAGDAAVGEAGGETRDDETARGRRRSFLLGFGTCLANPKAAVFAMSFLPQFVPPGQDVPLTLVTLAVVWVLVDLLWYTLVIWAVARARAVLGRPAVRRRLEQLSGIVLIGLGARLLLDAR